MKRAAWVVLGVLAVAALGGLALTALLPRMLASEELRARIAADAEAAFGRALAWQRLELAWPSAELVMLEPRLAGAAPEGPAFAQAPAARLHLTAGASLAQPLWIDRVRVEGATLRPGSYDLAPAPGWELRELDATLVRAAPAAPLHVEAAFALAGGGRGAARGSVTPEGELDLVVTLDAVELASAAERVELAGAVSGTLALAGRSPSPDRISAQLAFEACELRIEQIALRGPLRVELELAGAAGARGGRFALDATDADLRFGRSYRKPPGTPATVQGRIVARNAGALGVDDVKLHIGETRRAAR